MARPQFQKHRAWFENLAALLGLCIVIATMLASFESVWFFFLDPFEDAWPEFALCEVRALVAILALFSVLVAGSRWLPQRRLLRWPALALVVAVRPDERGLLSPRPAVRAQYASAGLGVDRHLGDRTACRSPSSA